jgi:hypothetical protein
MTTDANVHPLRVARVRSRLATTPGRLRLAAAVLALAAVIFGVIAVTAASDRRTAADSVATRSEPQLMRAEGLYASLSDADATAATTFLTGGIEPPVRRQRYLADLKAAGAQLSALARHAGNDADTRAAASRVATELPVYAGLVEAARSNNREGFPIGAAYLRQASELMRTRMLPAAQRLYVAEAARTNADYRAGTANGGLIAAFVTGGIALALLLLAQFGLARFSNRRLNVRLVIATVLLALAIVAVSALVDEQNSLASAQRKGSDSVQLLSASRVLALRAQRDESLALIGRGSDTTSLDDFDKVMVALRGRGPGGGVLGEAERAARRSQSAGAVAGVRAALTRLEDVHRRVAARERRGDYAGAVRVYVADELPQAERLDAGLESQTRAAQRRFAAEAEDATEWLDGTPELLAVFAVLVAALAVRGIAIRVREYR